VRRLLVTDRVVPGPPIIITLIKEALSSSEMSILTRATQNNIQEALFASRNFIKARLTWKPNGREETLLMLKENHDMYEYCASAAFCLFLVYILLVHKHKQHNKEPSTQKHKGR
jgi:hypothetical protein